MGQKKYCKKNMNFYSYLRTQFNDLKSAKIFYRKWAYEWDQNIPGHPEWSIDGIDGEINGFSMRAMSGHISAVLTGDDDEYENTFSYMDTKYGSEIFFS